VYAQELVRIIEVLLYRQGQNVIHTVNRRKANWIGHSLRGNCLLKHVVEDNRGKGRSDGKTRKKTLAATE
jgi:hypothetical protein